VPSAQVLWLAVNQPRPIEFATDSGTYFVMQLFVGEPLFLVTGHAIDLKVVDYIKSIEFAGKFYAQIEQALRRSQLVIFLICGAIALLMLLAAVWLAILFATRLTEPIGGLMAAADNAHQRRLARAVLANERMDFAAKDIEVNAFNGVNAAEALVDAGQGDEWNHEGVSRMQAHRPCRRALHEPASL